MSIVKEETRKTKAELKQEADDLWRLAVDKKWGVWCEVSPAFGKKQKRANRHHFFPKGRYGHLKFDVDNGVPLTYHFHMLHHQHSDPIVHAIIRKKRGERWYQDLLKKAEEKKPPSYKTKVWYEKQVEKLKAFLYDEEVNKETKVSNHKEI